MRNAPRRRQPLEPTVATYTIPAPVGGVNTVAAGLELPPGDCVVAYNLIASESGLRARLGYQNRCIGLTGVTSAEVRTIIPFTGSLAGTGRIFATTESGIWNVGLGGAPVLVFPFAITSGRAGYGVSTVVVTAAGYFLLYADEENGYHIYSEMGGTWSAVSFGPGPTQVSGVDPSRLVFVMEFKGRVWFVERDSPNAWYLPTGQVYGVATQFPLGSVFRSGGALVGLWNWTYDGGSGLDDSLVVVSAGGDVLVYQGTDPSSAATFGRRGTWQIGTTPGGRRIGASLGGELLLLSRQGLAPMSRLVVGAVGSIEYATAKVANLLNRVMASKGDEITWAVVQNPEDNALMVVVPRGGESVDLQLVQAQASKGWFPFRDLPIHSAAVWEGQLWFGTSDGRVCRHTGFVDNVSLDASTFEPVSWSLITAPTTLGSANQKMVSLIRPLLLADAAGSSFEASARYRYDLMELDPVGLVITGGAGTWDNALWDVDVWGGDAQPTQEFRGGGAGVGVEVAVALRGSSIGRTVVVSIDVSFQQGGFM